MSGEIDSDSVGNFEMVPGSPLKNDIFIRIELLDNDADHGSIRIPACNDGIHTDRFGIVGQEQRMPVRKQEEVMEIGGIAVAGPIIIDDIIKRIGEYESGLRSIEIGEQSVWLPLEIERRVSGLPVREHFTECGQLDKV